MRSFLKFIIYILLASVGMGAYAQSPANGCSNNFSQINAACISQSPLGFKETTFLINKELDDDIIFYKLAGGEVGKLKVISTKVSKFECTLYLDAVTYGGERVFIPNSSITIGRDNNWLKDRIFLNRDGSSAIELIRQEGKCVARPSAGVQFAKFFNQKAEDKKIWKEEYNLLYYSPLVLIFIAIFIVIRLFMEEQDKFKTQEALEDAENTAKVKSEPLFIKVTKPFYKRYFVPLTQGKNKQKYRNMYRQKLANAGILKEMSPEEFQALKLFMILGGPLVFLIVRFILEETWPLSYTPLMGIAGYLYPNMWLEGMIKRRNDEVLRALPFIIDMLALSVEAGLDFMAAIQRVIEKAPKSALVEEFETLIKETKIGSSRAEGLRQLGWRVNIIEVNSFCATLIAADSVGASIGPILKQLSAELRVKRSSRAEQLGATAATKILLPMIMFILPAVLVAIFAPMLLQMIAG